MIRREFVVAALAVVHANEATDGTQKAADFAVSLLELNDRERDTLFRVLNLETSK